MNAMTYKLPAVAAAEDAKRTIRYRLIGCEHELEQALAECSYAHMGAHLEIKLDAALLAVRGALMTEALRL